MTEFRIYLANMALLLYCIFCNKVVWHERNMCILWGIST